uniref:RING-type E3 ubiquitin transferase (cysteine targeting) n=1 Tax=Angiostrongylus cantonensis TaxID=6313 RepID=A0A0K0DDN9_ANGCA
MACKSLRVGQVDANILDREYQQLVSQQFEQLTVELPISIARLCDLLRPEIHVLLNAVLWTTRISRARELILCKRSKVFERKVATQSKLLYYYYTTSYQPEVFIGASPGQMEMGISYKDYSHKKMHLHFLLSVLVPYFTKRIWSLFSHPLATRIFSKVSAIFETICILHYLNFLHVGGHSTFVESVLGLRNWNARNLTIGAVNYESQNRELLWHTFRDALLLVWPAYVAVSAKLVGPRRAEAETDGVALRCGHCGGIAVAPMRSTRCGHIACYWCVTSRAPTDLTKCVVCGEEENQIVPVKGTLLLSGEAGNVQDER